ncbi:MAG: hypothetical protein A3H27_18805 [Acidobacteria bacterium RIFCSPLOWO2_02_FULL_59_13]|nr:MAG: hypothetical protein A3H27_18805 [Acidobacteria bacterium RIFCSPLOWO2_02_FULL_59_13]
MGTVTIAIDGRQVQATSGVSVLAAARAAGIYLPALCAHPSLPTDPLEASERVYRGHEAVCPEMPLPVFGCGLCMVEVEGEPDCRPACATLVQPALAVQSNSEKVRALRQKNLSRILAHHPHACLTCAQKEGCSRTQCSSNVPPEERCCEKLGHCELEKIVELVGIASDTPRYRFAGLPIVRDEPFFLRDYNLCIGCRRCVRACEQLRGVGVIGYVAHGRAPIVGTLAESLLDSGCRFCGTCVEVCPTGALRDKLTWTDKSVPPCREACPVGLDIPSYVRFIAQGQFEHAAAVIRQKVPFAAVLGRVCHHPCESACRRAQLNEPVAICSLKRFVADEVPWDGSPATVSGNGSPQSGSAKPTGQRVAVVGAGPSGLTAAYFLARKGHAVTVFEAMPEAGGMLRYGLAEYRLPTEVVEREVAAILKTGIELRTNSPASLPQLQQQGFDAIYLAAGAAQSKKIPVKGSQLPGVYWGLDFLRAVRSGMAVQLTPPVVVIGGGNVAMDVALTAHRLTDGEVRIACLESRQEMPAFPGEIEQALAEGICLDPSWGPQEILGEDRVQGIRLVRCTSVFDENRQFRPQFNPLECLHLEARTVILAIGQTTEMSFLNGTSATATDAARAEAEAPRPQVKGSFIQVEPATMATSVSGVFSGGDVAGGIPAVIHAIAMGRKAAASIDRQLGGNGEIDQPLDLPRPSAWLGKDMAFAAQRCAPMPSLALSERRTSFAEVELGFNRDAAVAEAQRCLQCDLRAQIEPAPFPPSRWLAMKQEVVQEVPDRAGVIQLLNEKKEVVQISGSPSLRRALLEHLAAGQASYFLFEEEEMYTQRESELLQTYLSRHGKLPPGNDLPDDLF